MPQTRRNLLKAAAAAPVAASAASKYTPKAADATVYTRLGVKPVINGMGTVTVLGGSLMPPEVVRAMDDAARFFIPLPELHKKAGEHLAKILNVPGALVTGGAASSFTVAVTACMTRGDQKKLRQLPDTTGIPHEVIMQKSHRSGYEHQFLVAGARIVTVETKQELEAAIGPNTAMMFFLNKGEPHGQIKRDEWIRIAKQRNIPTFNDAAADVPGKDRLTLYVQQGFDLVTFSGGKGLLGPQSSGLLVGRKDLTDAGVHAQSPSGGIGRGMKVGKEEIVGLVAAVERYLRVDHDAEIRELDAKVSEMMAALNKVKGVKASKHVPEIANEVPHLAVDWEESRGLTAAQVHEKLQKGDPAIYTLMRAPGQLLISVWMMQGNEHKIVTQRLKEILSA